MKRLSHFVSLAVAFATLSFAASATAQNTIPGAQHTIAGAQRIMAAAAGSSAKDKAPAAPTVHNPKLSRDLEAHAASETLPVIIQYKKDPGAAEENRLAAHGGLLTPTIHSINAHAGTMSRSQLDDLANDPNVAYITPDRSLAARDNSSSSAPCVSTPEFTTEPINAPAVWQKGYTGTGIGVAVIDSGISPVDDLSTTSFNFFGFGNDLSHRLHRQLCSPVPLLPALLVPITTGAPAAVMAVAPIRLRSTRMPIRRSCHLSQLLPAFR